MAERLFLDERELQRLGFSEPNIRTLRALTEFVNLKTRVTSAETDITTLEADKADKTIDLGAGAGLTGGGTLAANRTFAVGAGTGITVNADDVAIDTTAEAERIRDVIGTALVAGSNITITPDDGADTITIASGSGYTDEQVRDVIGTALVAGSNITITVNDGADTITIASSGASASRGALVKKSADQTTANYSAGPAIAWDAEEYDTDTIHDNVTNNSRLSVPSGVTMVRVSAGVHLEAVTTDTDAVLSIRKNGVLSYAGFPAQLVKGDLTELYLNVTGPVVSVTGGTDYFEAHLFCPDTSITLDADQSWFAMEIVE